MAARLDAAFPFAQLLFEAFAEPLLNHALVVQITRPRKPLQLGEHPRVDAQSDGDRLGIFGAGGHSLFHQAQLEPVLGPIRSFGLFVVEEGNVVPCAN